MYIRTTEPYCPDEIKHLNKEIKIKLLLAWRLEVFHP
jgi:hypothetical protein